MPDETERETRKNVLTVNASTNLVKKELILFGGAPKTGKYVLTRKFAGFFASLTGAGGH